MVPLVSVIIPTHNRLSYLCTAIESVLEQSYKNYEIIVVDDGSDDGTKIEIPRKYAGKINYYYQENQGRSAARNIGASLAKGPFLAFLDSDDVWMPLKLEKQVAYFSDSKYSESAAVCSSVYFIDKFGDLIFSNPVGRLPNLYRYEIEKFFYAPIIIAPPSNMLIRKECFDKVGGFDIQMSYGEDWDLIIRLRKQWKFLYIDEPLICYRFTSVFLNDLPPLEKISAMMNDMLRLYRKINSMSKTPLNFSLEKCIASVHEKVAYWYFARKAYPLGVDHLIKSGKLQSKNLNETISNLGYWGAYSAVDRKGFDPAQCELEFCSEFFPNVMRLVEKEFFLSEHDRTRIFSEFYIVLASHLFSKVDSNDIRLLCLKAINKDPWRILSRQTLKMLFASTYILR